MIASWDIGKFREGKAPAELARRALRRLSGSFALPRSIALPGNIVLSGNIALPIKQAITVPGMETPPSISNSRIFQAVFHASGWETNAWNWIKVAKNRQTLIFANISNHCISNAAARDSVAPEGRRKCEFLSNLNYIFLFQLPLVLCRTFPQAFITKCCIKIMMGNLHMISERKGSHTTFNV